MDTKERHFRRISTLSGRLRWALRAGAAFVVLMACWATVWIGFGVQGEVSFDESSVPLRQLDSSERIAVVAVLLPIFSSAGGVDSAFRLDPNLGLLLVGVGVLVVGHVMSLDAEMAEEASLIV